MANNDCLPQIQACAIRVAYLDANGVPSPGANKLYVSDSLTEMSVTPVYEDADEISEPNACGATVVSYQGEPTLTRGDGELTIASQDPYLVAMLGGGTVLTDGGVNGWAMPAIGQINSAPISIELWAKRIDDGELHNEYPYAWHVFPKVTRLKHGQRTFSNGAQLPTFSMQMYENENWFDGPLNDWPVESDRFWQWFPTDSLPTISCGPQTIAAS